MDCWFEGLRSGPEVKEAPLRVGELLRPVLQEDAVVLVEEVGSLVLVLVLVEVVSSSLIFRLIVDMSK